MAISENKMHRPAPKLADLDLRLPPWLAPHVYRWLGLSQLEATYYAARNRTIGRGDSATATDFCDDALQALGCTWNVPHADIDKLKTITGPLVFVANHPFGIVDALLLLAIVGRVREEFLFLANSIVGVIPELAPVLLPLRIYEHEDRTMRRRANVGALKQARAQLANGGALAVFPAGEVAELPSFRAPHTQERAWHPHIGALIARSNATVVPIYFSGENSWRFRYVGKLLPKLRVMLIVNELQTQKKPGVVVGEPIRFPSTQSAESIVAELREKTLALGRKIVAIDAI